jgi:hypothetical protein
MKKLLVYACVGFTILHFIPVFWPLLAAVWALITPVIGGYAITRALRRGYLSAKYNIPLKDIPFGFWEKGFRW